MKKMSTYGKGSEDAVSPVIGVILMVAITVILAAVIAAFVFGMAGNVQKTRTVAVTAMKNNTGFILTNMGGNDANAVGSFPNWTIDGAQATGTGSTLNNTIGSTAFTTTGYNAASQQRIIVVAKFNDGTTQVVLDTNL